MYSYIAHELPSTVFENFKQVDGERVSIFGHSMGGHGALTLVRQDPYLAKHVAEQDSVPQEPWQIQIRLRVRPNRQSEQVPLGRKGILGVSERQIRMG